MDKYIGTRLDGRYEILELVGEGGMANVYRGTDLSDGKTIAVKILHEEFSDNEELVRRFKNEGRAISVLNHPNIVKVFDVNVGETLQYMAMEYIDGITLKEYIEQRGEPLTYKETIHFVGQVLQALQHAHDKGIVHRDIKPQNIMIVEDGSIKVMDFGIARLARSEIHTATDQAIGSVHYISPEQAQGAETDQRADLYSVGIMMYEMLTAKLPFESDNAVSVAIKQISDEAEPLCKVNPSVPEGLADITAKAMAKDPRNRYRDAYDMLRDIDEFKRNPSIKFEYDYLEDSASARYIDKVVNNAKKTSNSAKASKSKKKKVSLLVPIVAAVTFAIVLTCFLYSLNLFQSSGNPLFNKYDNIELPDFVGMNYSEVEQLLKKDSQYKDLRLQPVKEEYNPNFAEGAIISQNPTSSNDNKKSVKANQKLFFVINGGAKDVSVPDVTGMSRTEAVKAVLEAGLRPYARTNMESDQPGGRVITTDPAPGTVVQNTPDMLVTIWVSGNRSDYNRTVPQLIGLPSREGASSLLDGVELQLGMVKEVHDEAPEGTVLEQSPTAGATKTIGARVNIVISKGPEPAPEPAPAAPTEVEVPGVTGSDEGSAAGALSSAGLNVSVTERKFDPSAAGTVLGQSIGGGQKVPPGTVVGLVVSKGPEPAPEPPATEAPPPPPPPQSTETPPTENTPPTA